MGGDRARLARLIATDSKLRGLYESVFGTFPSLIDCEHASKTAPRECKAELSLKVDAVFANVGKALAAFETTLVARSSPFDDFLKCLANSPPGKCHEIDAQAITGLLLFAGRANCVNCHHGRDLTDDEFHNVMLPDPLGRLDNDPGRLHGLAEAKADAFGPGGRFSDSAESASAKLLRASIERPELFNSFRTPSLRQVALTSPYMHNGIYVDLRSVLNHYSTLADAPVSDHHSELLIAKLNLTRDEIEALIAFLGTLTSSEGSIMGKTVNTVAARKTASTRLQTAP